MRGLLAFMWAAGLGWYIRASGLDEDIARAVRQGYDLTVLHTAEVLRRGELELASSEAREEVAA